VCCSALQRVAVRCSVLHAVCYSTLPCVAASHQSLRSNVLALIRLWHGSFVFDMTHSYMTCPIREWHDLFTLRSAIFALMTNQDFRFRTLKFSQIEFDHELWIAAKLWLCCHGRTLSLFWTFSQFYQDLGVFGCILWSSRCRACTTYGNIYTHIYVHTTTIFIYMVDSRRTRKPRSTENDFKPQVVQKFHYIHTPTIQAMVQVMSLRALRGKDNTQFNIVATRKIRIPSHSEVQFRDKVFVS